MKQEKKQDRKKRKGGRRNPEIVTELLNQSKAKQRKLKRKWWGEIN